MSTISSHLNWGSSYVVHDFYHRFVRPTASEKHLVAVGRWSTALLMLFSALFALVLSNALQAFQILLQIGAGTGLLFILRWFWYRINAYSEITAMVVSFLLAIYFQVLHTRFGFSPIANDLQFLLSVGLTTLAWVAVTLLTAPSDMDIDGFCRKFNQVAPVGQSARTHANQRINRAGLVYSYGDIACWWVPLRSILPCFPQAISFTEKQELD